MINKITELEDIITSILKENNFLKNEIEKKEFQKNDLLKQFALNIIEVLDSFKQIEERAYEKGLNNNEDVNKTMNRYKNIQKKLMQILKVNGITKIEFPDNKLIFGLCEVIDTEYNGERENDEIISVVRDGFIKGKELIRSAQVIVVKN